MKFKVLPIALFLLFNLFISACTGPSNKAGQPDKPTASITSPASNSSLSVGEDVLITFNAADVKGIARVELLVNGQVIMQDVVEPAVNSYTASHRWTPDIAENYVIELRVLSVDNVANDLAQTVVTVADVVAEVTPTPLPTATNTPAPIVFTPTSTPEPGPVATDVLPTATSSAATLTSLVRLNVRFGPSTDYPVVGVLGVNKSVSITGRDEFSNWWQIEYQSDSGDRGWVSASGEFSAADNADGVPLAEAPPLETVATSTPVPTEAPPSATPDSRPTILTFTATRYNIVPGESIELSWDLTNAQAAYLRYEDIEEGVVAPGNKIVSPDRETKYILVARNENGEVTAELTITVGTTPTPEPVLRDGKIRIADGQYIDFDQGLVLAEGDPRSDFQWSGTNQQFFPQGGASGSLLSRPFGEITLAECQNVAYNKPIDGVDGSTQVTGCYRTGEGRFGKFLVSEWDLAANLTIEWVTWQ